MIGGREIGKTSEAVIMEEMTGDTDPDPGMSKSGVSEVILEKGTEAGIRKAREEEAGLGIDTETVTETMAETGEIENGVQAGTGIDHGGVSPLTIVNH